jgi:hypothetical protein
MTPTEAEIKVYVATDDELRVGVRKALRELGMTADELREEGETGEFRSEDARVTWFAIADLLDLA